MDNETRLLLKKAGLRKKITQIGLKWHSGVMGGFHFYQGAPFTTTPYILPERLTEEARRNIINALEQGKWTQVQLENMPTELRFFKGKRCLRFSLVHVPGATGYTDWWIIF